MIKYKIVADKINNMGGRGKLSYPKTATTHHTAVATQAPYNVINRLKVYSKVHGGYFPYHFYISRNDENVIYITQWFDAVTWHNSNGQGNYGAIAIVMEGNYEIQDVTKSQLERLKKLYDDLENNYFTKKGYIDNLKYIKPKSQKFYTYSRGVKVKPTHYHNQITEPHLPTACCGKNLIKYVVDYSNKKGKVQWGGGTDKPAPKPKPPAKPEWQKNLKKIDQESYILLKNNHLYNLNNFDAIKSYKKGEEISINATTTVKGKEYLISTYSYKNKKPYGFLKNVLIKKTEYMELENKIKELQKENKNLNDKKSQLSNKVASLQIDLSKLKSELNKKDTKLDECLVIKEKLNEENIQLKKDLVVEEENKELDKNDNNFIDKIFNKLFNLQNGLDKILTTSFFSAFVIFITEVSGVWENINYSDNPAGLWGVIIAIIGAFSTTIQILRKYAKKIRS